MTHSRAQRCAPASGNFDIEHEPVRGTKYGGGTVARHPCLAGMARMDQYHADYPSYC
jgi:hypothetical protein